MENYEVGGTSCLYGDKVKRIREVSNVVLEEAQKLRYEEVILPSFEDYDLYKAHRGIDALKMVKTIDNDGRVMVLRPDATIGLTKFVSKNFPVPESEVKLFYISNIFREYRSPKSIGRDFLQAGVEYFGNPSLDCEAEVIGLAADIIHKLGINNLQLGLGSASYLNSFLDTLELSEVEEEQILEYLEGRNLGALVPYLEAKGVDPRNVEALVKMSRLVGPIETVLSQAEKLVRSRQMSISLEKLKKLSELLGVRIPGLKIKLDFSLTRRFNYYTDTIFELYAGGMHVPVVSGGRYDKLSSKFGAERPAFGFGLNINLLLDYNEEQSSDFIRIALAKGRFTNEVLDCLKVGGVEFPDYHKGTRKLRFCDSKNSIELILVKSPDVTTYVESGAADLGIVGSDILGEREFDGYILKTTSIGKCRMSIAKPVSSKLKGAKSLTVASKYPRTAGEYLKSLGVQANIIKLNGSVELGPIVGLADAIIDIVESGKTLEENGLVELDSFRDISSQIICNKVSFKTKQEEIEDLLEVLMKL